MAEKVAPIAMPGEMSNRTDKGLVERVQKVQRDAKLNRASGGEYNARNSMNQTMVGTNIPATGSAVSQDVNMTAPGMGVGGGGLPLPAVNAFDPGSAMNTPYSEGSPWGPGKNSTNLPTVEIPDNGSILARALLAQNPTNPQLRALVEAYNEVGM